MRNRPLFFETEPGGRKATDHFDHAKPFFFPVTLWRNKHGTFSAFFSFVSLYSLREEGAEGETQRKRMWSSALLYLLPLLVRVALNASDTVRWADVLLSALPLAIVVPTLRFPTWFREENTEHVVRHAMYALAFTVSAGVAVRWDVLGSALQDSSAERWALPLAAYLAIGTATLWWFCFSHVIENVSSRALLRTHQGDVAVLPLTLVAISTFAADVPDEAVRFWRSALYFVPVVVAWATLHFIAYQGFALSTTTTHTAELFQRMGQSALLIASLHLLLLEARASSVYFQFLPPVAALFSQLMQPPSEGARPGMGGDRVLGSCGLLSGSVWGWILSVRYDLQWTLPLCALGTGALAATVPPLLHRPRAWPLVSGPFCALGSAAVLDAAGFSVLPADVLGLLAGSYAASCLAEGLAKCRRS